MSLDVYAHALQPVGVPVVWMQAAPYDPRRGGTAVAENHTNSVGEHRTTIRDTLARSTGFFRSRSEARNALNEVTNKLTFGSPNSLQDAFAPSVYATGDTERSAKPYEEIHSRALEPDEISRISDQRTKLLAASFEQSTASAEILARLAILNRRLLEKSPRISKVQLDQLEKNIDELAAIREDQLDIMSKLNELSLR